MGAFRTFLRLHRHTALLLLTLALCMKALIPGGYMIGQHGKTISVEICADASGGAVTKQIVLPQTGKSGGAPAKMDGGCAYGALAMAAVAGAEAALLALALVFILALGFAPFRAARQPGIAYLRPPLRGPPTLA